MGKTVDSRLYCQGGVVSNKFSQRYNYFKSAARVFRLSVNKEIKFQFRTTVLLYLASTESHQVKCVNYSPQMTLIVLL